MNRNRLFSSLLAVFYIIMASAYGGMESAFKVGIFLILPLACIWFVDAMGGYIGPTWGCGITSPTPGVIVCIVGWLLLFLPILIVVVGAIAGS